jgi:hypothetical protein
METYNLSAFAFAFPPFTPDEEDVMRRAPQLLARRGAGCRPPTRTRGDLAATDRLENMFDVALSLVMT